MISGSLCALERQRFDLVQETRKKSLSPVDGHTKKTIFLDPRALAALFFPYCRTGWTVFSSTSASFENRGANDRGGSKLSKYALFHKIFPRTIPTSGLNLKFHSVFARGFQRMTG